MKAVKRPRRRVQAPLALRMMGRQCVYDSYALEVLDPYLSDAYRVAGELTDYPSFGRTVTLWEEASKRLDFGQSKQEAADTRRDLIRALDVTKLGGPFAPDATKADLIDEMLGPIDRRAREAGFLLGLAVAFRLQRAMNSGREGA